MLRFFFSSFRRPSIRSNEIQKYIIIIRLFYVETRNVLIRLCFELKCFEFERRFIANSLNKIERHAI